MNYKKHLKELRNKLASQRLSLLAGAGLSMNASTKFVTWESLLIDLAYELHKSAIDTVFAEHVKSEVTPQIEEKEFIATRCKEYIRSDGYLDIVSAYIKRKGYNESIATYIEERIPTVLHKNGNYYLELNGVVEELPKEKLSLHRSLVDLPWNNIYTTNYDDLLDVCIDQDRTLSLQKEIDDLEIEIQDTEKKISITDEEMEELSMNNPENRPSGNEGLPLEDLPETPQMSKEVVENQRSTLIFRKEGLKNVLSKYETLQRAKEKELHDCYQVVKSADGLRIKKQKNIIKLHGSLRSADEKSKFSFEFDGDHKNQYIIAKEDYENYPQQHEAFTQLMRISLLQESFCLLGFSGVDQNFREWINWVRDILYKAAKTEKQKNDYKIYLVETSQTNVTKDLQLFYENHKIVRIPLLDPDVIAIIQQDIGKPITISNRREALEAFVLYLNNDEDVKVDIPSANISAKKEYRQVWEKLSIFDPNKIPDETTLDTALKKLDAIRGMLWLPNLDYFHIHNQQSVIDYTMMATWNKQLTERPDLLRLLQHAIEGIFVPIQNLINQSTVQKLLDNEYTANTTKRMLERTMALSGDKNVVLPRVHDQILQLAYSFQFGALETLLKNSDLQDKDRIVGAGFLALIDPQQSVQQLEHAIWNENLGKGEQMLYSLELLYFLKQPRIFGNDLRVTRMITAFEHSGYKLLQDAIDLLVKQVDKKRDKQKPYGSGRFNISRSMHLSKGSDSQAAVQMLMLLAESGFQLTVGRVYLQSHDAWYMVLKAGFHFYPAAFLFYSLQFSNKDFLKKAGQDYAFSKSEAVLEAIPGICEALFQCLFKGPKFIKDHIPDFLSGLVVGVPPKIWQADFGLWWQYLVEKRLAFKKHHSYRHAALINAAILYIDDSKQLFHIVYDCLLAVINGDEDDQSINFLYYLNRNIYFKSLPLSKEQETEINDLFNELIGILSSNRIELIFVLGNLFHLLSDEHKTLIQEKLKTINLKEVNGSRVWRILVYFANGDDLLNINIQEALVNHRLLWYTGINGKQVSGGGKDEFIQLSGLASPILKTGGLRWTDYNLHRIYEKLINALKEIDRIEIRNRWFNFTDILEEMTRFLEIFKLRLKNLDNYNDYVHLAQSCLEKNRNYKDLEEGLTSRESNEVINALSELSDRVYENRMELHLINLVMNKILLQAEPAIEETINYVAVWVADKKQPDRFRDNQQLLIRILKKYEVDPLIESDEAFVEVNLVRIAWRLNTWGVTDPIIKNWLDKAQNSKFNNVKQFIVQAEKEDGDI